MGLEVTFLGSGDAFCASGSHQAAYLVQSAGGTLLLDCGATSLAGLKRAGIPSSALDAILISHMHGDHFAGLPFIFLDLVYVAPRTRPLVVAGPPGIEARVNALFSAMYRDAAAQPLPFRLEFVELAPDVRHNLGEVTIDPFRVPHQQTDISLGFSVEVEKVRVVYSGDTGWTEELVTRSRGSDLFICECNFYDTRIPTHLDYRRIAENRARLETQRLVLTHLGSEVLAHRDEIPDELARDGLRLMIGKRPYGTGLQ